MFKPLTNLAFWAIALVIGAGCGTDAPPAANNSSSNNQDCEQSCALGDRRCLDDETVQTCIRTSGEDRCNRQITTTCLASEICDNGDCIDLPKNCEDTCIPPRSRCTANGQAESCSDYNNDGCFEFGGAQACESGDICDQSTGLCKPSDCTDLCERSATACQEGLLSTCFPGPEGCLIWGPGKECPSGEACQVDACVTSTMCDDECVAGTPICAADSGVRGCSVGADGCAKLDDATTCPNAQSCREGQCVANSTCRDRCISGEKVCIGNDLAECLVQNDGCLAFSSPTTCPSAETCTNNGGTVGCQAPAVTGNVVINEVFYNPVGQDVRNGASPSFIELWGPPGFDIAGWEIDLVNGSTGASYNTFSLPGGARLDGNGFAVLAMTNADNFLNFAAPGNKYFILAAYATGQDALQNGPDSVVLRDSQGAAQDAVGYGNFQPNDPKFAGEGDAAVAPTGGRSIGRTVGVDTDNNAADFLSFYPTPGLPNADLVINEIYVDQPGSDTGTETFVELVAPIQGWEDMPLDGYILHAINGFNGMDYIFSGALFGIEMSNVNLNDGNDGYVVACNIDTANPALLGVCTVPFVSTGDFQNGPDNFVLTYLGREIDAVGYGTFSGATTFVGEGSSATWSGSLAGKSLGRWPVSDPSVARDTDNNSVDFRVVAPSPAADNPLPTP